jgi:ATP-dependent Zn protease
MAQQPADMLYFLQARTLRPCIIFMDEIDAVGRTRGGAQVCVES